MVDETAYQSITGYQSVVEWFGGWPSFHDAEVTSIELHRHGSSYLRVHTFRMTGEFDERGYYKLTQHAVVTFEVSDITSLDLSGFNHQNVLSCLLIQRHTDDLKLVLGGCYGVEGQITSKAVSVSLVAGSPSDGIYAGHA
jgi:hypothetical protein